MPADSRQLDRGKAVGIIVGNDQSEPVIFDEADRRRRGAQFALRSRSFRPQIAGRRGPHPERPTKRVRRGVSFTCLGLGAPGFVQADAIVAPLHNCTGVTKDLAAIAPPRGVPRNKDGICRK